MQPPQDGAGDPRHVGDRFGRRRALEQGKQVSQVVEEAPALGANRRVTLESSPGVRP
jgi:hypothetical protein